jgi:hypothetical protein
MAELILFIIILFVIFHYISDYFYRQHIESKDNEIKELREEIYNLEQFQDEILDLEEEMFDAWLEAIVRQRKSFHDQSET